MHSVLVVEDNNRIRKLVQRTLEAEGFHVRAAKSAEEALDALSDWTPDVVLADIGLPGIGGLELTRRIRANPATRHVRVITMTGEPESLLAEDAVREGADHHLVKPIPSRVLIEAIRKQLDEI